MKKFKKIKFMYIFLGLSVVSLATVGFANWVIINTDKTTVDDFNVVFGQTSESTLKAELVTEGENKCDFEIRFDSKKGDDEGLITSGTSETDQYEKLDFKVVVKIDKGTLGSFDSINVNLAFDKTSAESGTQDFIDAFDNSTTQYIDTYILSKTYDIRLSDEAVSTAAQAESGKDYLTYETAIEGSALTLTLNYKFKWGDAFGGLNPSEGNDYNAVQVLNQFKEAFTTYENRKDKKPVTLVITPSVVE